MIGTGVESKTEDKTQDQAGSSGVRGHHARYLEPVTDELDTTDLVVQGEIPRELEGSYVRNGPNSQFQGAESWDYPYEGDGMVHVVTFDSSGVRYRNRWVLTQELVAERHKGDPRNRVSRGVAGSEPEHFVVEDREIRNWSNTNVVAHGGKILALWERGAPYELNPQFGTVGEFTFDGGLPGAMTAHPKIDPVWDELSWFRYSSEPPYLVYGVVSPRGNISRTVSIDLPRPVVMHDFAVTDQHVVFFDSPAVIDPASTANGTELARWAPEHGTRIGVISRDAENDHVRWFPTENFFAMHVVNAYNDGSSIVVDYIHRSKFEPVKSAGVDSGSTLHRCVIELHDGIVRDKVLDANPMDLPCIDGRRSGLAHRYGYFAAVSRGDGRPDGMGFDALLRYDFQSNTVVQHRFKDWVVVGEPQFVPRPGSVVESDGWILALTYDIVADRSELVILDAQEFAARPVAVVQMPRRVPAGLHGTWIPSEG